VKTPTSEQFLGAKQRADGATLVVVYVVALLVIPARLVLAIPMTLPPALVVALGLGLAWLATQMVNTLGMGKGRNAVRFAVTLFLAAHLLTYGIATRRYLPIDELTVADSSLIRILATVSVAIFLCDAIATQDRLDRVLKVVLGCTAVVAAVGLLQFGLGVDLPSYVSLPGLRVQDTGYAAFESRSIFRRPTGTTNHPIEYGLVCAIAVPLGAHYVFKARDAGVPAGRWWVCLALVGLGAMTALSRTAILGLVVSGIVMVVTLPKRRKASIVTVGGGFFLLASLVVPGMFGTLRGMFTNLGDDPSVKARTADYADVSTVIDQHPLMGRGFGTYLPSKFAILDNQYLTTIIENGYVGLVVLITMLLTGLYAAIRARSLTQDEGLRGIGGCLIAAVLVCAIGAATFDLFAFGIATGMLFVVMGMSGALLRVARAEKKALDDALRAQSSGTSPVAPAA
jgi:O-antigen ligase